MTFSTGILNISSSAPLACTSSPALFPRPLISVLQSLDVILVTVETLKTGINPEHLQAFGVLAWTYVQVN